MGIRGASAAAGYRQPGRSVCRHRNQQSISDHLRRERAVLPKRPVHRSAVRSRSDPRACLERQRPAAGREQHGGVCELSGQLHEQPVGRGHRESGNHSSRRRTDRAVYAEHRDWPSDVPELFGSAVANPS